MSRLVLPAALVAMIAIAACTATPIDPSPSAPANPASPSAPPSALPPPSASPITSPPPTVAPPPATPAPSARDFTADERYLLDGVRRGAVDCEPVAGSDDLPENAIAGIECASPDPAVSRIGFYLFENEADMLDAYIARMTAEGIELNSGSCREGEGENAYTPGEGLVPDRNGCFINDEGFANYRIASGRVYIGILGRSADMRALEDFAWFGNQDVPGTPTLWAEPG